MRNIKLTIEYDGTRYNGWQRQSSRISKSRTDKRGLKTIQEEIEKALKRLIKEEVVLNGAGRTDSGVHAEAQIANFKTKSTLSIKNIRDGLNSLLPEDIAVKRVEEVGLDFDSRFDSKGKLYRYRIFNAAVRSPLSDRYITLVSYPLDIFKMKKESRMLIGRHDFRAFQASSRKDSNSVRNLKRLDIVKKGRFIDFYIEADGFLHNMVRNIVGTLIEVGRGRFPAGSLKKILSSKSRGSAGPTAPAEGLCLLKVKY